MHIYADSWAHKDYGSLVGHFFSGTKPDEPFRNIDKAMEASTAILQLLRTSPDASARGQNVNLEEIKEVLMKKGGTKYYGLTDDTEGRVKHWKDYFEKKDWDAEYNSKYADDDKNKFEQKAQEILDKHLTIRQGDFTATTLNYVFNSYTY